MSAEPRDDMTGREVAGLVIIVIGFGLLLNALGMLPFSPIIGRYWLPALFVTLGIFLLKKRDGADSSFAAHFFIGLGLVLFIARFNYFTFNAWRVLGPAIVIWIGFSILIKGSAFRARRPRTAPTDDTVKATALLGAFEQKPHTQQFAGGELTALMGGATLDLRDAEIAQPEAVLDVFTLMGGIEIIVPDRWLVQNQVTVILGAVEDTSRPARDATKRLIIRGSVVLGSVEVRN